MYNSGGYKNSSRSTQLIMKFQMLVSIKISRNSVVVVFFFIKNARMLFVLLINVKMPTTFISQKKIMLS